MRSATFQEMGSLPRHRFRRRRFLHLHRHRSLCHLLSHPPRLPFPHHRRIPRRRFLRLHLHLHLHLHPHFHRSLRRIPQRLLYRHPLRNLLLRVIRLIPIGFRQVRRRPRRSPIHRHPLLRRQVPHPGQTQAGLRHPLHHLRRGSSPLRESFARVCWGLQRNP